MSASGLGKIPQLDYKAFKQHCSWGWGHWIKYTTAQQRTYGRNICPLLSRDRKCVTDHLRQGRAPTRCSCLFGMPGHNHQRRGQSHRAGGSMHSAGLQSLRHTIYMLYVCPSVSSETINNDSVGLYTRVEQAGADCPSGQNLMPQRFLLLPLAPLLLQHPCCDPFPQSIDRRALYPLSRLFWALPLGRIKVHTNETERGPKLGQLNSK